MAKTADKKVSSNGRAAAPAPPETKAPALIRIDRIPAETIRVPIIGTSPLIMHRFSEKAKRMMLDSMMGDEKPKEPKNPQAEYEAAFYRLQNGEPGFPALAFKDATVKGARFYPKNVTMAGLKQCLFFRGEVGSDGRPLVPIIGEATMRDGDPVSVGRGGKDLRYRPQFLEWRSVLEITYVKSSLTRDSVLSLVDAGGMGVGVGDWRPEKDGDFGTYQVDLSRDVEII